jgi:type VI secretion system secreted protein VgrG
VAGEEEGGDDTATEFEAGTETPGKNEDSSSEPVGVTPATALTVTATLALTSGASTGQPATEGTATTVSIPVVETDEPITPTSTISAIGETAAETVPVPETDEPVTSTVTISATVEAAAEITPTVETGEPIAPTVTASATVEATAEATPTLETAETVTSTVTVSATVEAAAEITPPLETNEPIAPTVTVSATVEAAEEITLTTVSPEDATLPDQTEPTPPRPDVVELIMERTAGEQVEVRPGEPAGASPTGTPEAAISDPISEQPEPDLPPAPDDVPAPDNLPVTGLLIEAPSSPSWVAGGVTILLLVVGVATLLKRCE